MRWPEYKMSQLTSQFISGGTPNTKERKYWEGEIPWIIGADIVDGEVVLGRRYINEEALDNSATNVVPKGSILMVTRTGVGKIAIAPVDIAISQDFTGIVLKKGIDHKFALAAIKSRMNILLAAQRGATIKGVTRNDVKSLTIPLLPLSEQRRIVEILDQADALRKKRTEADEKAERILPALFYRMFGDPATNPMGWEMKPLGELALINPKRNEHIDDEMDVSFIPMTDIDERWGRIIGEQVRSFEEVKKGYTYFKNDDVLFAKITPCMENGKAAITRRLVNGYGFGSTEFHVIRAKDKLTAEFIYGLVRRRSFRLEAASNLTGTVGQQRVPSYFLNNYPTPVPPIEIQMQFAHAISDLDRYMIRIEKVTLEIEKTFSVLLHRAFSGDLTASWRQAHMKELLAEMEQQARAIELTEWEVTRC